MTDLPPIDEDEVERLLKEVEKEQENWDPLNLPESQAQLAQDIRDAGGPDEMISKVGAGIYHDYVSPHPMPKHYLVLDCEAHDLYEVAKKAREGYYDP